MAYPPTIALEPLATSPMLRSSDPPTQTIAQTSSTLQDSEVRKGATGVIVLNEPRDIFQGEIWVNGSGLHKSHVYLLV
jgi:hypothetical protein